MFIALCSFLMFCFGPSNCIICSVRQHLHLRKLLSALVPTKALKLPYRYFIFTLNHLRLLKEVLLVSTVMSSDLAGKYCLFFFSCVTSFICCKWLSCLLMNCCLVRSAAALRFPSWFSPPAVMLERDQAESATLLFWRISSLTDNSVTLAIIPDDVCTEMTF